MGGQASRAGGGGLPGLVGISVAAAPSPVPAVAPLAFTSASAGDPDAVSYGSDEFWRNADDEQVGGCVREWLGWQGVSWLAVDRLVGCLWVGGVGGWVVRWMGWADWWEAV